MWGGRKEGSPICCVRGVWCVCECECVCVAVLRVLLGFPIYLLLVHYLLLSVIHLSRSLLLTSRHLSSPRFCPPPPPSCSVLPTSPSHSLLWSLSPSRNLGYLASSPSPSGYYTYILHHPPICSVTSYLSIRSSAIHYL